MKTKPLVTLVSAVALSATAISLGATALAAPQDLAQLEVYPKNLARQHLGANLFHYTASSQAYTPTEAAAAWLDDDITTGWPILAGKQYYLLALPEPELITNFCLSARPAEGTINLYAGDEPAPPGAKSWISVAHDLPFDSINEKKMVHGFSREAKYLLIETNVADPGPVYSVYLYGDKPAVAFKMQKREQPIDTRAIFGPFVNEQTSFNLAGLYAQGYVAHADTGSFLQWQKAIDDNPESALAISPSTDKPNVVIRYQSAAQISRIALLANSGVKGKLDFYLVDRDVAETSETGNQYIKVSTDAQQAAPPVTADASDTGATPTISIVLDGTNSRTSVDFPAVQANEMLIKWTPVNATDSVEIHELNAFGTPTLAKYTASIKPEAVAALGGPDRSKDSSKDGKDYIDPKDNKVQKVPGIGELLGGPYLPGSLGFPPNLTNVSPPTPPPSVPPTTPNTPNTPVSPPTPPPVSP